MSKKVERPTQESEVLNYLQSGKTLTSMDAIQMFGATRLSAIIFNLRDKGYDINTKMVTGTNRYGGTVTYGEYSLNK